MNEYVIKVGNDYVKEIGTCNVELTRVNDSKLRFPNKEIAEAFMGVVKLFVGNETINVKDYQEDLKETSFIGMSLKDVLDKAEKKNSLSYIRAKELFENEKVLSVSKSYGVDGLVYESLVRSSKGYDTYSVEIKLDKQKRVIATECNCKNYVEQDNLTCKHVLATILEILNQ